MVNLPPRALSWKICEDYGQTFFSLLRRLPEVSHLVRGLTSAATNDSELRVQPLRCEGILTDVLPPN